MSELITQPPQAIVITEFEAIETELAIIEQDAKSISFDYSDKGGNKDARSYRASVRKVATRLEGLRVGAKRFYLDSGKAIDAEAKKIVARIDAITNPHTIELKKLEDEEKERVANHEKVIAWIIDLESIAISTAGSTTIKTAIDKIELLDTDGAEEFKDATDVQLNKSLGLLKAAYAKAIEAEDQAVELKRLQDEAAERKRLDDIAAAAKQAEELERAKSAAMIAKAEFMAKESQQRADELEQRDKDRIAAEHETRIRIEREGEIAREKHGDDISETFDSMAKIVTDSPDNYVVLLLDAIIAGKIPHLKWSNQ